MSQELPADSIRELIMNAGDVVNACKVISAKDDTKYNVDGVEDDADGIEDDADGVKNDVDGVKNDVDGAKDDADGVKDELGNVKFGVKTELDAVERYRRLAAYMEVLQNQRLLNIIENNPELTQAQYAGQLGVSKRTVSRMFSLLQEQGLLEQQGTRRKPKWAVRKFI